MNSRDNLHAPASDPEVESVNPYSEQGAKGEQVEKMFDSIAPAYDFMNTAMTFGLHRYWRDKALKSLSLPSGKADILDVATGTGDVAFRMAELYPQARITGGDISRGMLEVARKKQARVGGNITFTEADCLALPFADESFDAVTVAYGVRNFPDLLKGYREMWRVLRPGGMLKVIELSQPASGLTRILYNLYSRHIIPLAGRLVSKDPRAYTYLPESIAACPQREEMTELMSRAGFPAPQWKSLTFGAVTIYTAVK